MAGRPKSIQVFEWETLRVNEQGFTETHHASLHQWQDRQPDNYFKVGHQKITFTQWVGVIQVASLIIEVLPKADRNRYSATPEEREASVNKWKSTLVEMLRKTGRLKVRTSENTDLSVRHQSLFDLYFQNYLEEVELLIHRGLVKKYRREAKNRTSLKGKLLFQKQLVCNMAHEERFYSEASQYDRLNDWNEILLAALRVTGREAKSGLLQAKAKNLSLHFPDWPNRGFNHHVFERLQYDRKTKDYERTISLAKLILLQLNPQIASGKEKVIAILFDMNRLWEDWLLASYQSTYRHEPHVKILGKRQRLFWESKNGHRKVIETDILIEIDGRTIVLDAKWKIPDNLPSDAELKQMFVYNLNFGSREAFLVYPNVNNSNGLRGRYCSQEGGLCEMMFVEIFDNTYLRKRLNLPNRLFQNDMETSRKGSRDY